MESTRANNALAVALEAAASALRIHTTTATTACIEPQLRQQETGARVVLSFFDYSTLGLEPWHKRGFSCHAFDIRHPAGDSVTGAGIHLHGCDLNSTLESEMAKFKGRDVAFAMAFPPCTNLSRAGARYWAAKAETDPEFQTRAVELVKRVDSALRTLSCPFYIENPASSRLRNMWRPPDFVFEPFWYGAYLAQDDSHPQFPTVIPKQDSYTKRTGLWVGGGFIGLPRQKRVEPLYKEYVIAKTGKRRRITPLMFSGGAEGKEARQTTPRGFSEAICGLHVRGCARASEELALPTSAGSMELPPPRSSLSSTE